MSGLSSQRGQGLDMRCRGCGKEVFFLSKSVFGRLQLLCTSCGLLQPTLHQDDGDTSTLPAKGGERVFESTKR